MSKKTCGTEGCNRDARARGRCNTHYHAWRREHLNIVKGLDDDPRIGFCNRLSDLLTQAPEGLLTEADHKLINAVALTAATAARGVIPITAELRRQLLHTAVDALDVPEIVAEAQ
ncbi:hypothetical protein [Mycobacteroides saopaulense]|uniref:HNH endonuclease n=1 Tax=Mycobacteroides saopaulense TaxID=1578165 RepID=A0ABX3C1N6_9MYCO|nr:hypothetical protein [Mycobacteroides saopaulense]OHT82794.1 hypothetical protein BKG68_19885 [Mycobacteroides saopaulense]OHU10337.1 hypothetical protein BKG73_10690 [Mycobacteroides saopaulense]